MATEHITSVGEVVRIEFYKKEVHSSLLDPKEGFFRKSIAFELRKDPLTGHVSRILPFRFKLPQTQIPTEVIESSRKNCPFCPEQVASFTPKLVPEIAPEGRIQKGEALLFPNSFPYAQYNWVAVLSGEHFLYLDQFSIETLKNGFLVAQHGINRLRRNEPESEFASINWNYLPQAGGGILHPHLQVVVEGTPTSSHRKVIEGIRKYKTERDSFFWDDLLSEEVRIGERYIGKIGNIHFLTAFSPLGILGEVLILFSNKDRIEELTAQDWEDFSEGLVKVFRFLKAQHIESFNLSVFSGGGNGVRSWVYGRLCPRIAIPPWNTSDINYFEKLHDEVICVVFPEEMNEELKKFF